MARVAVIGVALVLLSACGLPGGRTGCTAQIDWVDFIQVGSVQYLAAGSPALAESDLGPTVAHVKFKVSGNVCDPNYRPRDGDAAFLDPGTAIYAVNGHPTSETLAAHNGGRIIPYQPLSPPGR